MAIWSANLCRCFRGLNLESSQRNQTKGKLLSDSQHTLLLFFPQLEQSNANNSRRTLLNNFRNPWREGCLRWTEPSHLLKWANEKDIVYRREQ